MIDEKEINYYRTNIIGKYISEVQKTLETQKVVNLKRYRKNLKSDYKLCKKCGKYKPLSEFYKNPLKYKGVFDYCKECARERAKQRREEYAINKKRNGNIKNVVFNR